MDNDELEDQLNILDLVSENSLGSDGSGPEGIDLNFENEKLTYDNIETICEFIKNKGELIENINLSGTNLNDKKLEMLSDKLKDCYNIKNIDFSNNKLENIKPLENVINKHSIENVDLSKNYIKDVKPIAKGLNKTSIKSLDLDNNLIEDIKPIATAMEKNQTIETLSLEKNYLNNKQAITLSNGISKETSKNNFNI
ncbi:MAG: hypothetical protein HRU35_04795 [Rickettsiaceae bacterium]|nr:hypothetical protein [Rickettsiaceae bacterium]